MRERIVGDGRRKRALQRAGQIVVLAVGIAVPMAGASAALPPVPASKNIPPKNPTVEHLLIEADGALANGQLKQALINLKLAAGMEPSNPVILLRLGMAENLNGDFADAEVELRHARSLGAPDDQVLGPLFEAMLTRGKNQIVLDLFAEPAPDDRRAVAATILRARASALQSLGDPAGATRAIQRALAIRRDFDILMTAARIAQLQQQWASAQAFSDEALKLSPNNIDALVFKVGAFLEANDRARALAIAEKLVAEHPKSLAARLARIKVYLAQNKDAQARPDVDLILRQAPRMAIALYYRAIILARDNKLATAWSVAHVLPAEFIQGSAEIAMNVASMAVAAGFLDSAATILNKAVFNHPAALDARLKLVELRLRQNSPQYALNALAVVEDSKDPRVALAYAQVYSKTGNRSEAQRYIERAISLGGGEGLAILGKAVALQSLRTWQQHHPDDVLAHKQYAILLLRFGDLANAKIQYEQLVRSEPTDALALNNLSWLVVNDDPKRALTLALQAVKQQPTSPDFLDTLGCMQMRTSDFKAALDSLNQAHRLRMGDPEISYHLVLALDANGARTQAKPLLAAAVAQGGFADLEPARKLLASWH